MVFTTEGLFEVAIETWSEWDLNPRPLNSVCIQFKCGKIWTRKTPNLDIFLSLVCSVSLIATKRPRQKMS